MARKKTTKNVTSTNSLNEIKNSSIINFLLVLGASVLYTMVAVPINFMLFQLLGAPLSDRFNTMIFDNPFYYAPSFVIAFFIAVILGWMTQKYWISVGLSASFVVVVFESVCRFVRLKGVFTTDAVLSSIISPKLFLYTYILVFMGFLLGCFTGNKAFRENHRVRLYVFAGFLAILIICAQIYFFKAGVDIFNPFSKAFRGVF